MEIATFENRREQIFRMPLHRGENDVLASEAREARLNDYVVSKWSKFNALGWGSDRNTRYLAKCKNVMARGCFGRDQLSGRLFDDAVSSKNRLPTRSLQHHPNNNN
jgi:hypothetical protein